MNEASRVLLPSLFKSRSSFVTSVLGSVLMSHSHTHGANVRPMSIGGPRLKTGLYSPPISFRSRIQPPPLATTALEHHRAMMAAARSASALPDPPPASSSHDRLTQLRATLRRYDDLYYNKASPEVPDSIYDALKAELRALESLEASTTTVAAVVPQTAVGAAPDGALPKVAHFVPLLSLESVPTEARLTVDWRRKLVSQLKRIEGDNGPPDLQAALATALASSDALPLPFIVEPKVDGLAIRLLYVHGRLRQAATRGDGATGEDVTHNAFAIRGLPHTLLPPPGSDLLPTVIEVRGEVFMTREDFATANAARALRALPPLSNPRNAAAGGLRLQDSGESKERLLSFIGYQVLFLKPEGVELSEFLRVPLETPSVPETTPPSAPRDCTPGELQGRALSVASAAELQRCGLPATQSAVLTWLAAAGARTNPDNCTAPSLEAAVDVARTWMERRDQIAYDVDGCVLKLDSLQLQEQLGSIGGDPRWAVAWKFPAAEAVTTLKAIELCLGRTGNIVPVALLEPVLLQGARISKATLHNVGTVRKLDLRIGDRVIVRRSGDVIPQVARALPDLRAGPSAPFPIPAACPSCGQALHCGENEDMLRCTNAACPGQASRGLEYYAAGMCKGLSKGLLGDLRTAGLVADIPDLYELQHKTVQLLSRKGWGEKKVERLLQTVEASKAQPLPVVLAALGLPRIGKESAGRLAARVGSLTGLLERAEVAYLEGIEGFGPVTAQGIVGWLAVESNRALIAALLAAGVDPRQDIEPEITAAAAAAAAEDTAGEGAAAVGVSGRPKKKGGKKPAPADQGGDGWERARAAGLRGIKLVITGSLERRAVTRGEVETRLRQLGATVGAGVARSTDLVVRGSKPGSAKLREADAKGVRVIGEEAFWALVDAAEAQAAGSAQAQAQNE